MVEAAASGPARWNLRRSCAFKLRRTLLRAGGCCAPEPALRSESWKLLRRAVEAARKQRLKPEAAPRGGNRKLLRRCVLVLNCEDRARRMGLQPRLARAASSCACSEAASSPWSGSRGRDQPLFGQRTAKIVKAGVAGPAASDRGGEAEMRAPTRMRPTTPAKIKPRSSRHAHAADEPATAEAVPLVG